jgi:hypothetical protein
VGERSLAKDATYRQHKKRPKTTYEESLLEIIKKIRDNIDKKNIFYISGTVFQKAE